MTWLEVVRRSGREYARLTLQLLAVIRFALQEDRPQGPVLVELLRLEEALLRSLEALDRLGPPAPESRPLVEKDA